MIVLNSYQFIRYIKSMSQSQSIEEQAVIYEEDEVVWAKIRGYPWWPAAINQVRPANSDDEDDQYQYTVFFFGDNTHSQLGPQKLRRFLDYYPEFYPKAKTNKKLFNSILRAEQKLKNNGVNTDYYVSFRDSIKRARKGRGATQSRISSQDHGNQLMSDLPELNKNKTFQKHDESQSDSPKQHQSAPQKIKMKRGPKKKQPVMKSESEQESKELNQIILQKESIKLADRTRSRKSGNQGKNIQSQIKIEQKEKSQSQSSESEIENYNEKKNNQIKILNKVKSIAKTQVRKRGRPKKIRPQQINVQIQKAIQHAPKLIQKEKLKQKNAVTQQRVQRIHPKRRVIERKNMNEEQDIESQQENSQQKQVNPIQSKQLNSLILERIKFCLNKRQQLIQYMDQLPVGPQNVQQILELNVTNVLLQGSPSIEVIRIMEKLKANLLYKFFPNDLKFKKKMQKINKKFIARNSIQAQEESLQDLQLRKKTIIKLQKILRQSQSLEQNNQKLVAVEIQSNFRKYDETIGQAYKLLAYRVLRSLKDKRETAKEVIRKLQSNDYDYDHV